MEKEQVQKALENIKENSQKRKFKQSVDLIINLKDLDLKKPDNLVNTYITLHYQKGRDSKICALVGPELLEQAKQVCDGAISVDEFDKYKEKKEAKKLASQFDYFIAQATIMPKIATVPLRKLLLSAVANAKENKKVTDTNELIIKDFRVDQGIVLKRSMPRAHGSAYQILKRTSKVTLVLSESPLKAKS